MMAKNIDIQGKSGKKIKLGTVGWDQTYSVTSKAKTYTNANDDKIESTTTNNGYNFYAPTKIKVTYYDKLSKTYGSSVLTRSQLIKAAPRLKERGIAI